MEVMVTVVYHVLISLQSIESVNRTSFLLVCLHLKAKRLWRAPGHQTKIKEVSSKGKFVKYRKGSILFAMQY